MCWVPVAEGLKSTEQVATFPLPLRVHCAFAGVKVPLPSVLKVTVPVGTLAVPLSVSETVAVQFAEPPTAIGDAGVQLIVVLVVRVVTLSGKPVVVLLLAWVESLAV